jgi:hypothetical protein
MAKIRSRECSVSQITIKKMMQSLFRVLILTVSWLLLVSRIWQSTNKVLDLYSFISWLRLGGM